VLTRLIVGLVVIKVTAQAARLLTAHAYAAGMRDYGVDNCPPCPPECCEIPPGYGPR
jgi:hypothetical protein